MTSSTSGTRIKVCGITRVEDAAVCVDVGVDAIGLNFWSRSKRRCPGDVAKEVVRRFGDSVRIVAVLVNATAEEQKELRSDLGIDWLQLHGDEPPEAVRAALPQAYKAVSLASNAPKVDVMEFPGDEILVDSADPSLRGGTGAVADWSRAKKFAETRPTWLAGGIRPENVRAAIEAVEPYGVDTASGVELRPGIKSGALIRALVEEVRGGR
ncbi:MAG: phosphoribosylanthranilate isomerase [Myxococcota bacterium]